MTAFSLKLFIEKILLKVWTPEVDDDDNDCEGYYTGKVEMKLK